jgi:hypothetical protein
MIQHQKTISILPELETAISILLARLYTRSSDTSVTPRVVFMESQERLTKNLFSTEDKPTFPYMGWNFQTIEEDVEYRDNVAARMMQGIRVGVAKDGQAVTEHSKLVLITCNLKFVYQTRSQYYDFINGWVVWRDKIPFTLEIDDPKVDITSSIYLSETMDFAEIMEDNTVDTYTISTTFKLRTRIGYFKYTPTITKGNLVAELKFNPKREFLDKTDSLPDRMAINVEWKE